VTAGRSVAAALRDPTGTPVLACAVEGHADYVVTGDRDLLDLGRFRDIPIVSPAAFAALLQANE
jgi:predicted nucleic acid-binding protein